MCTLDQTPPPPSWPPNMAMQIKKSTASATRRAHLICSNETLSCKKILWRGGSLAEGHTGLSTLWQIAFISSNCRLLMLSPILCNCSRQRVLIVPGNTAKLLKYISPSGTNCLNFCVKFVAFFFFFFTDGQESHDWIGVS